MRHITKKKYWVYVIYTPTFVEFLGELFSEVEEFCHCNQVEPVFQFWKLLPVREYLANREKIYTTPPARLAEWVEHAVIHARMTACQQPEHFS